jgi:DNA primase
LIAYAKTYGCGTALLRGEKKIFINMDVVEIISQYIPLKKIGIGLYAGQCPFHPTNSYDSFRVWINGTFKCFNASCGVQGNAIKFVMRIENISFKEAVKIIKEKGFSIDTKNKTTYEPTNEIVFNTELLSIAAEYYHSQLLNTPWRGMSYLEHRGITDAKIIKKFKLGYSNKKGGLYKHLLEKGFSKEEIIKNNVAKELNNGYIVERLSNRIVFPIFNNNNIVYITSRAVDPSLNIKHLHLGGKIKHLYNEEAIKQKYAVLTEGIFDCLSLLQEGINACATYGTEGLNGEKAKKFINTDKVYICFDKDENMAGQIGAYKAATLLRQQGIRVYIVKLPYISNKKADINALFASKEITGDDFKEFMENAKKFIPGAQG